MRYLHTMVRIRDIDEALDFYVNKFGLVETRRTESEQGRFTLIFLSASQDQASAETNRAPELELTYNWDPETYSGGRNFGHLAYEVDNIYNFCQNLKDKGVTINRPPRDGRMAFVKSPDGISIEILQKGEKLAPQEPWASMENTGSW
ncbi:VOC family protein [Bacillus subtilis]|uniref:VOC family protein n=1 Tax=Pseudochrobactrum asaccharolyticum TaxID=354351 RepID=UPI001F3EABF4|nr:VOC family protein [Pseudochrobactrum asaccharolyticum]MCF7647330.1 VOC family protein [Pseudochrobactrum asaccharolyticum]MCF7672570.1 VOC family protein [Bacillus subtilis]